MRKKSFLFFVLCLFSLFYTKSLYSQSIERTDFPFYWEKPNNNSFFIGGGYWGNYLGWNSVLEYRQRIANTGFSFQPAFLSYGGTLESNRFGYQSEYANFQLAANFTYSFARLMNISFIDMRLGAGIVAGAEYVQYNPIYNTKTWNPVVGPNAVGMIGFLINKYVAFGVRYQFNYLPKTQVSKTEHILSLGVVFKFP